jgi:hypothetical protein
MSYVARRAYQMYSDLKIKVLGLDGVLFCPFLIQEVSGVLGSWWGGWGAFWAVVKRGLLWNGY